MGRPKKSAKWRHPWAAARTAKALGDALALMQNGIEPWDEDHPDFDANWERLQRAWQRFGVLICDFCDPDNPDKFLRIVADELKGKLRRSPADDKIWTAYWNACNRLDYSRLPTFAEFKKEYKDLSNGSIPADSSLRRSICRLGLRLKTR
jgi:hypothetical protein